MNQPSPEPGSFRDPTNRILRNGTQVFRGYSGVGARDLAALEASGFFQRAMDRGDLVRTWRVDPAQLGGQYEAAVEHEQIPFISYPYEWTFSMLKEAALLTLRLTREAISEGLIAKDATPYNVQFVGSRPIFIDIGSFERLEPGEPWFGYRQFCQQFLNPLLLQARLDVPFQPWLRGSIAGIDPGDMAALLPFRHRIRPGALTHVLLHAMAEAKHADSDRDIRGELKRAGFGPAIIQAQISNLIKTVEKLDWERSRSVWSDYSSRGHYTDADLLAKEKFVGEAVASKPRGLVWDLGANDGRFSEIAAQSSSHVIAVDSDALVVDRLFRDLRSSDNASVLPLVMDLIDSSPPMGWRSHERGAFFNRARPDFVLALALVHHMVISGTVPPAEVIAWLASLGAPGVVEVPHRDDPMVQRLLRTKREGIFDHYRLEVFDAEIRERFVVERTEVLPSGTRTLFQISPRAM